MQSKWRKVKLGEVCKIRRGSSPRPIVDFMAESGMPWVKISDATESHSRFIEKTNEFIKLDGVKKSVIVEEGDLILSNSGTAGLPKFMKITACIHDGWQTFTDLDGIDKEFLYYSLINIRSKLLHNAYDSTMKNLTLDMVRDAEIILPKLEEQQRISAFLSTIDSKLEINQNINQTLEEMAQAIFKSWFVDFDPVKAKMNGEQPEGMDEATAALFPNQLVESELGLIPEGWTVLPFKSVIDKYVDNRGKTPPIVDEGIPLVEVKHLLENSAFPNLNTEKRVTAEIFNSWFRVHVEPKDVLISTVGTIGRTSYVKNTDFGIAQNVLGLRFGKIAEPAYMFYTIKAERFQHEMDARLVTTVQSSIKRKDLDTISILIPPSSIQQTFCSFIEQILDAQYSKTDENIELAKLRDALLPKLLSGEIELEG